MKHPNSMILVLLAALIGGCAASTVPHKSEERLTVVTWNVQTFFDAVTDGTEYSEYRSEKSRWSRDAYERRLKTLCTAIKKLDADVYVLEEIENAGIIYDIANQLAGGTWNPHTQLQYALFAKDEGAAIGCAVLSRFPLSNATVHALDVRSERTPHPAMRPLIAVTVTKNTRPLVIFVNHWKSKFGGAEKSEVWRDWQESVLAGRMAETPVAVACGDFNRDIAEFAIVSDARGTVALRHAGRHGNSTVNVTAPWLTTDVESRGSPGSYFFRDSWECIDHFFITDAVTLETFTVATGDPWTNKDATPDRYTMYNGRGCSDHLPLVGTIRF